MKRILAAALVGSLAVGVAAALFVWSILRASLPVLDGEIALAGLTSSVTIERDDHGIPTITASNRGDLAFATGFAHAQDRFFQMDLIRRRAAGELAEIVGPRAVEIDKKSRLHRFRDRARAVLASAPDEDRHIVERYAAGVNAGLAGLRSKPFEYYLLGIEPESWRPEDSVLVVYTMYMQLNDPLALRDVQRGLAHRVLPGAVYDWIYQQGTSWDAPMVGEARTAVPVPSPEVYSLRSFSADAPPSAEQGRYPLNGSNNWAVSGDLTENGGAIVANDMHLGLNAPNIYYQVQLAVDGDGPRRVAGVSLPGTPYVVAGSNSKVAWGYTNSYGDWSDAVLLRPGANPGTYRTPDGDRSFDVFDETIVVKGAEPVTLRVRETIWGPVLDDRVRHPDGDIAVSWIAHKADGVNLRLTDLESADSVAAALDIANKIAMPPQNFVVGDAAGNIGWTIAGRIPRKNGFDAWLPADWSDEHGWLGWLEPHEYPRIVNPESGRIWTANARVVDGDALRLIGDGGYDLGARARQIRDQLFARRSFVPEDMLAIQIDDRALFLSRWRELLLDVLNEAAVDDEAGLSEFRDLVDGWIPRATPESVGYRLVRAFRLEVKNRLFHAILTPVREAYGDDVELRRSNQFEAAMWSLVTERPAHMLPAGYDSWDAFLIDTARDTVAHMKSAHEGPLDGRKWGEINTAAIRHPLSQAVPWLASFLDMPSDGLSGDLDMPKAQGPTFGASERFSIAVGDEANSLMHMPTGQSGHPLSEFYDKGHADWVEGRPSPFLPGTTRHTLTLRPDTG